VTSGEAKLVTRLCDSHVLESKFDNKGGLRLWLNGGLHHLVDKVDGNCYLKLKPIPLSTSGAAGGNWD